VDENPFAELLDRGQPVRILRKRGAADRELNILEVAVGAGVTIGVRKGKPSEVRFSVADGFLDIKVSPSKWHAQPLNLRTKPMSLTKPSPSASSPSQRME
jgi:hypothetical protein